MALPEGIRAVLLDIEGTTTPLSFVTDTLFPYARERLEAACARGGPEIDEAVDLLRREHRREREEGRDVPDFGTGAAYAEYLMDRDRKSTGLKMLQGILWREGYRDGTLRGEVFDDVPPALKAWREAGIRLRIFSSGSVEAQKLLFGNSDHGDLTGCFEGYHDTRTGAKKTPRAYETIAEAFDLPPERILFLSDNLEELDAARDAGLRTGLLDRPGNPTVSGSDHPSYETFRPLLPS